MIDWKKTFLYSRPFSYFAYITAVKWVRQDNWKSQSRNFSSLAVIEHIRNREMAVPAQFTIKSFSLTTASLSINSSIFKGLLRTEKVISSGNDENFDCMKTRKKRSTSDSWVLVGSKIFRRKGSLKVVQYGWNLKKCARKFKKQFDKTSEKIHFRKNSIATGDIG